MSSGNPYKRVTTGQKLTIPAQAWNALMGIAEPKPVGKYGSQSLPQNPIPFVLCVNNSSAAVTQFGVMGIAGVGITESNNPEEFKNNILLNGTNATFSLYAGKFVIAAEPIVVGGVGRCYIAGAVPAYVDIVSTSHKRADVKDGDATQLQSGTSGSAQILWADSGTGSKWAVVHLGAGASSNEQIFAITGTTVIGGTTTLMPPAYRMQLVTPAAGTLTLTGSGTLTTSSIGTASGTDAFYGVNRFELGSGHQDLNSTANTATFVTGIPLPLVAADGYPIWLITGAFAGCS